MSLWKIYLVALGMFFSALSQASLIEVSWDKVWYHSDDIPRMYGAMGFTVDTNNETTQDWWVRIDDRRYDNLNEVQNFRTNIYEVNSEPSSWIMQSTVVFDELTIHVGESWSNYLDSSWHKSVVSGNSAGTMRTWFKRDGDYWYGREEGSWGKITPVPEPATLGLLATGLALLGIRRRII